ncbi:MAG TPA: NUDIX hydrolase [Candidatus Saccharimonadales bacterium]|nr:NUDIX hydrolase [Candidatus Saccharimonadales bacterium]
MSLHNHALYQVATKALIFNDTKLLVLRTPDGYVDFPGGRVDETERAIPWTDALLREVAEELGTDIKIEINQTLFVSKRQYQKEGHVNYIAAIFFASRYVSGDITLSDEHGSFEWMTVEELLNGNHQFVSDDERAQLHNYVAQNNI